MSPMFTVTHCIRPIFQGAQFLRIAIFKHFMEAIFPDQEFRVCRILKFRKLNFSGLLGSGKNVKLRVSKIWTYTVLQAVMTNRLWLSIHMNMHTWMIGSAPSRLNCVWDEL